jgi:hypothetical protein
VPKLLQSGEMRSQREHTHGQEEAGSAGDPVRAIQGQPAAGDETMHTQMLVKVLAPGVEHAAKADFGAEMAWIVAIVVRASAAVLNLNRISYTAALF